MLKINLLEIGFWKLTKACGKVIMEGAEDILKCAVGWVIFSGFFLAGHLPAGSIKRK